MRRRRSTRPVVPSQDPRGPGADMLYMLTNGQDAVRYADTKLGLLLTAAALTVPIAVDQLQWVAQRWDTASWRGVSSGVAGGLGVLLVTVAVLAAAYGLTPRLRWPASPAPQSRALNRFAWPTLVGRTPAEVLALPDRQARAEAAAQVLALSRIADRKFRRFGVGLAAGVGGGASLAVSGLIGWGLPPVP